MSEDTTSMLGKDKVWNGMIADVRLARLLDRINFSISKEETTLYIGIIRERMPMSILMPIMITLIISIPFAALTPLVLSGLIRIRYLERVDRLQRPCLLF